MCTAHSMTCCIIPPVHSIAPSKTRGTKSAGSAHTTLQHSLTRASSSHSTTRPAPRCCAPCGRCSTGHRPISSKRLVQPGAGTFRHDLPVMFLLLLLLLLCWLVLASGLLFTVCIWGGGGGYCLLCQCQQRCGPWCIDHSPDGLLPLLLAIRCRSFSLTTQALWNTSKLRLMTR